MADGEDQGGGSSGMDPRIGAIMDYTIKALKVSMLYFDHLIVLTVLCVFTCLQ